MGTVFGKEKALPRPIIFLDIDGVLNSERTRAEGDHDIAPPLLSNLAHVVVQTNAEIVLSSTWRLVAPLQQQVRETLLTHGIGPLRGATPDIEGKCLGDRVDEIMAWRAEHDSSGAAPYIAIDDLPLCAMNKALDEQHFVGTSDTVGLTREKAAEAVRKLQHLIGGGTI